MQMDQILLPQIDILISDQHKMISISELQLQIPKRENLMGTGWVSSLSLIQLGIYS